MSVVIGQEARDCAVCLQQCHYPTQLPCGHIFCFLCVKGVAIQSKKCAMCRAEIPTDYLDHPVLLDTASPVQTNTQANEEYQWFYEGRNGWWKYDERSNIELEAAFNAGDADCKLLLAGALYTVNFQNMMQVQSRDYTRRRRVKRDNPTLPAKGIAGIKITENVYREPVKSDSEDSPNNNSHEEPQVIETEDDDSSQNNETEYVSPENHSIEEILQRVSSLDLHEQTPNDFSTADSRESSMPEDT